MDANRQSLHRPPGLVVAVCLALVAGSVAARLPDLQSQGRDRAATGLPLEAVTLLTAGTHGRERPDRAERATAPPPDLQLYLDWHASEVHWWAVPQLVDRPGSTGGVERMHCLHRPALPRGKPNRLY